MEGSGSSGSYHHEDEDEETDTIYYHVFEDLGTCGGDYVEKKGLNAMTDYNAGVPAHSGQGLRCMTVHGSSLQNIRFRRNHNKGDHLVDSRYHHSHRNDDFPKD